MTQITTRELLEIINQGGQVTRPTVEPPKIDISGIIAELARIATKEPASIDLSQITQAIQSKQIDLSTIHKAITNLNRENDHPVYKFEITDRDSRGRIKTIIGSPL